MNLLAASPLLHALGWTLLHFCWQGAAVALLLWCVLGAVGASSRLRYAASCIALGLLVALPLITFARLAIEDYRLAALVRAPIQAADIFVSAVAGGATSPWTVRLSVALNHAMPFLLAAWCAGVLCLIVRLGLGLFAAHRLRVDGTAVAADLRRFFDDLCDRTGIARAVLLLNSANVEVPTVIGWLRPAVLLPASCLTGLAPDQIEAILCHELAHIQRHDYLISVLQSMVETLLFYHPAVWWVSSQIRCERECCCDEFAVSAGGDVLAYARALSFLEEQRTLTPQLALGANGGVLKMRIQRLLGRPESSTTSQMASIAILVLIAFCALTFAARHVWAEVRSSEAAPSVTIGNAAAPSSAKSASDAAASASQSQDLGLELDRIREVHSRQAGLQARLEEIKDGQAKYGALLAQAGRQSQLSDEDRNRLEDAARRLTDSLDAWVDQFQREIDARDMAMDRFNSPDFQKQMADATARINSAEFKRQLAEAQAQIKMLNSSDFRQQMAQAEASLAQLKANQRQMQAAMAAMGKIDSGQLQKHIEAERAAMAKLDSPEFRRQMQEIANAQSHLNTAEMRKRVEAAMKAQQLNVIEMRRSLEAAKQAQLMASNVERSATEVPSTTAPEQPNPEGAVRVSSGVMVNLIASQPNPVYPPIAKAAHVQGVVVLHAIISKEGTVEKLTVISGPPMLTQSAMDAVQKWTYRPYLLNGQPVEVETTINVNYTYGGDDNEAAPPDGDGTPSGTASSPATSNSSPVTDQTGEAVRRIGGGVSSPQVIHQVEPEFTDEAKTRAKAEAQNGKFEGTVLVQLIVNTNGQPENVHVVRGVGMGLDEKAVEAVRQYRFRPAMENGNPVPVLLNVQVNFKIF
jgi:TonB family protein